MTISTGNYDGEGVNRMAFPARTASGETVTIVEKVTRANESTVLIAEDGRTFEALAGDSLNLVEVVLDKIEGVVEEAVEIAEEVIDVAEQVGDAAGDALDSLQDALGGDDGKDDPEAEKVA